VTGVRSSVPVETSEAQVPPAGGERIRRLRPSDFVQRYALVFAWGLLCLFFTVLPATSSTFPTTGNFAGIFGSQAVIVVLTLGLLIPLTTGDYDLSVAYTLSLSSMILAILNANHHWAIGWAIVVALACAVSVGVINGALVVLLGINPFIVTLGTGTFVYGIVLWISASNTISGVSPSLVNITIVDRFLGIPLEFYYGLALCVVIWYVFEFTPVGRRLLVVGRGRKVARLSGLSVGRLRWGALIASAFVSGMAGVLYAGTTGSADPSSGSQLLLPAFAAAFLGATSIAPGRFNPWGAFIAVYFLVTGITGLQLVGVEAFVQQLFYGGALILAVALAQVARRGQELDVGGN
jgi:ribose transport system permease protein